MIYGDDFRKLKQSYTGGAVDMFIPTNDTNELVFVYDVNSLYPQVMANFPKPVGPKRYFEGGIRYATQDPDAFGFFYCRITTPTYLEHPVLQTHVRTRNGIRTVAGLGQWEDMIFSSTMDNCIRLGYKFEILWGYLFDKKIIFKEFVEDLYKMRLDYPKTDPMNLTSKILMNSLYGVFGMRDEFDEIKIVSKDEFTNITAQNQTRISEVIELDKYFLIQYSNRTTILPDDHLNKDYNINVAISSAITSLARDYMSHFKNHPKLKLFYTDTDSIYTNLNPEQMNELFPGIVSNTGLGKLKLETVSKRAIFLAPKCYCLETINGEIITKVKGFSFSRKNVELTVRDFEQLLQRDSIIQKKQTKWYKSLTEGTIRVLEQSYTCNSNNLLIGLRPIKRLLLKQT